MSKRKWHDISAETGDSKDLPIDADSYLVTYLDNKTRRVTEAIWCLNIASGSDAPYWQTVEFKPFGCYVIAWRELPKAFIPSQKYKHKVVISEAAPSDMALPFTVEVIVHVEVKPI